MVDTQGPEIRTAKSSDILELKKGEELVLTPNKNIKGKKSLQIDNLKYVKGIKKGGKISLDNGAIELKILNIGLGNNITCEVLDNGAIAGKKHVNFPLNIWQVSNISLNTQITPRNHHSIRVAHYLI